MRLTSLCLLALPLSAQEADSRTRIFGVVRGADGAPWAGAEVTALAWPIPARPGVGKAHRIQVRSDAAGRFRAWARPGLRYSVWARSARDAGQLRATGVVEGVMAQQPVVLEERPRTIAGRRVQLRGLEPWQDFAPLSLELIDRTDNARVLQVPLDSRGRARLPLLLGELVEFRLLGKGKLSRRLLVWREVPLRTLHASPAAVDHVLAFEPPREIRFRVSSDAQDGPAAGAVIYQASGRGRTWRVGRTDARGEAVLHVYPAGKFFARAAGSATGFFPRVRGQAGEHGLRLQKGWSYHGRLLRPGGEPVAGARLWVQSSARDGGQLSFISESIQTDERGRFQIEGLGANADPSLRLLLSEDLRRGLHEDWRGVHPVVPLFGVVQGPDRAARPIVLGSGRFRAVEFRCVDRTRAPVMSADLRLEPERAPGTFFPRQDWSTDRAGVCRLLLPCGLRLGLAVRGSGGMFLGGLELAPGARPSEVLRISLPRGTILRGRVLDPEIGRAYV